MTVRKINDRGKTVLLIDFRYTNICGVSKRFRKVADVQTMIAARAEETRLRLHAAQHGEPYRKREKCISFADFYAEQWLKWSSIKHKPSTRERYETMLKRDILKHFGKYPLNEINAEIVTEYASKRIETGVDAWKQVSLVRSILTAAHDLGYLSEVAKFPSFRRRKAKIPSCPDSQEIQAMLRVARGYLRVAIALAAYAGLRAGEVRALEVHDVDWDNKRLLIRRAMSAEVVTTTKSDQERIVPIAPELEAILRVATEGKQPTDRIILNRSGRTPPHNSLVVAFSSLLKKNELRHRTFHTLRHHFCTSLLQRGADIELVRVVAGHHSIATTARYLHARADSARKFMGFSRAEVFDTALN